MAASKTVNPINYESYSDDAKATFQSRQPDPLDEAHLDAVRGLMLQRGFTPVHQQVELVGAMRLRSTRTNRSAYCSCQGLDSKLKNLDYSSLLILGIFL